jgi:2,4-dienoyl-CoA reductase-like NADH-dependent reductase (Old Yellow Enzyme family)
MATPSGEVTQELIDLYTRLAAGGAALLISGHMFVDPRGQYNFRQAAIHSDDHIAGLARLTQAVHGHGARIFAELSHAGSQSVMPAVQPMAPSAIPNAMFSRQPIEMDERAIQSTIAAFSAAARRAISAGFDGIHIHGGNGYLLSQFASPISNQRTDRWGGDPDRRRQFVLSVYEAIRTAVGPKMPVTARIGVADGTPGGLRVEDGVGVVSALAELGLDAVEPTYGIMSSYLQNVRPYVNVSVTRAVRDWVVPRLWNGSEGQGYYRTLARAIKNAVKLPVILVGGVRSTDVMSEVLQSGDADFLAFARPFIREPDFPNRLRAGYHGTVACVSCNICLKYDGRAPLKCWRESSIDLTKHLYHELRRLAGLSY